MKKLTAPFVLLTLAALILLPASSSFNHNLSQSIAANDYPMPPIPPSPLPPSGLTA